MARAKRNTRPVQYKEIPWWAKPNAFDRVIVLDTYGRVAEAWGDLYKSAYDHPPYYYPSLIEATSGLPTHITFRGRDFTLLDGAHL